MAASQGVDELYESRNDVKAGDEKMQVEEDADPEETEDEFIARLDKYVNLHLGRASSSKRDNYKDALVYQARKDLINDFLKSTILKRCHNPDCGQSVSS